MLEQLMKNFLKHVRKLPSVLTFCLAIGAFKASGRKAEEINFFLIFDFGSASIGGVKECPESNPQARFRSFELESSPKAMAGWLKLSPVLKASSEGFEEPALSDYLSRALSTESQILIVDPTSGAIARILREWFMHVFAKRGKNKERVVAKINVAWKASHNTD